MSDEENTGAVPAEAGGDAAPAELEDLGESAGSDDGDISDLNQSGFILEIPVKLSVEVGRTKINIRELLKLNHGSVVELERTAGEPLDVMVNGTLIAHGEVVVVNDKFGIRLTDVISRAERIKQLN